MLTASARFVRHPRPHSGLDLALTILSLFFADLAFAKVGVLRLLAPPSIGVYFAGSHSQIESGIGFSRGVLLLALVVFASALVCALVARLKRKRLKSLIPHGREGRVRVSVGPESVKKPLWARRN
jgi:hypothetical protein